MNAIYKIKPRDSISILCIVRARSGTGTGGLQNIIMQATYGRPSMVFIILIFLLGEDK